MKRLVDDDIFRTRTCRSPLLTAEGGVALWVLQSTKGANLNPHRPPRCDINVNTLLWIVLTFLSARSRNIHTPPQTPPYHGTLNGHSQHGHIMPKNGTMQMGGSMGGMPMGPTGPNGMSMEQKPLPGPPTLHAGVG